MYNGVYTIDQFAYSYDTLKKWVQLKVNGSSLGEKLINLGIEKIAIYGANEIGQMVCKDIEGKLQVTCYIDRASEKYTNIITDYPVYNLDGLSNIDDDTYILVTPEFYFNSIFENLTNMGISISRIISLAMVV